MARIRIILALGVLLDVPVALAQPGAAASSDSPPTSATVVAVAGQDVVLDIGGPSLEEGATLTLYRMIEVKHPITGKRLRDRFVSGRLRIVQPGQTLSIARVEGSVRHPPEVGDSAEPVRLVSASLPDEGVARAPLASCAECQRVAGAQRELLEVWYRSLGRPPEERIEVMRRFLQAHPGHAYKSWFDREIAFFQDNRYAQGSAQQRQAQAQRALDKHVYLVPPSEARQGVPLELTVYRNPELPVRAVRMYVRSDPNAGPYQGLTLHFDERGHGRATVPPSFIAAHGFAYFVEAELPAGSVVGVLGSDEAPVFCRVVTPPQVATAEDSSQVRLSTEYVSFDGLSGRDYYYLFEADFMVRLPYAALPSVRLGYGHYRGEGGSVEQLDELGQAPTEAAFTYGYLEGVFAVRSWLAVMPRLEVGLGRANSSDTAPFQSEVRGGAQLRIRLGPERGTHLILAGETAPEIGERAFVGLRLGILDEVPIGFEVHVTDQPVNTDELGVRAVLEVGYRVSEVAALSARASYQGRTIDHTGPGLGLAATFDW